MSSPLTGAENVRWDLSSLYSGIDDPALTADLAAWGEQAKAFHAAYKGQLASLLPEAIKALRELSERSEKINVYAFLCFSTATGDAAIKAKSAVINERLSQYSGEYLTFFEHELVAIDDATVAALAEKDALVRAHMPWIAMTRMFKGNLLPEVAESYLVKYSPFGPSSWAEFFDEFEADLRFPWAGGEKTLTELLHLLSSEKDAAVRAEMLKVVNAGLGGSFAKYAAQTLWMVAGQGVVDCRERQYVHPMESRNKSSRLPDAVVDALHQAVLEVGVPLGERFYRLKASHLGLKTLKWSDRNAPMPFSDEQIVPWDAAVEIVQKAYQSFSPTLAGLVRAFVDEKRIDAPAVNGKRGGAYNYSLCLPGSKPQSFVFMNYLGSHRDVMTLAHELGHGAHGMLAGEAQGVLLQHAPMAYAETASVFGEMTTFNYLKARVAETGDKKALLALVMGKLDDMLNTVIRQISFSEFERRLHGWNPATKAWEKPAKRSVEELDALWLEVSRLCYGPDGRTFTYENAEHLWAYVSHFHTPFYVYNYAVGELLTQSLYARQAALGDRFEPLYLDLLRAGGSKGIVDLTAPFGLDPVNPSFWADGLHTGIGRLLAEAEELST